MMRDSSASLKAHRYAHSSAVSATVLRRFHTSWIYSKIVWYFQMELCIKPRVLCSLKNYKENNFYDLFNDDEIAYHDQRERIQFDNDKT